MKPGMIQDFFTNEFSSGMDTKAPYAEKIRRIIEPLRYDGILAFMRDDVRMSLDFSNQTWRLSNIHRFNKKGEVVLESGRNGLCFELTSYVYDRIRPMLPKAYDIRFLRTGESGFFFSKEGTRMVLCIIEPSLLGNKIYILDPSFKKYGKIEDFEDYVFLEEKTYPVLRKETDADLVLHVDAATPLVIEKDFMLWLGVESIVNKFDRDNYSLSLVANRKHNYFVKTIFSIIKKSGQVEERENKDLALLLLKPERYNNLKEKIRLFSIQIEEDLYH